MATPRVDPVLRELEQSLDGVTAVLCAADASRLDDAQARLAAAAAVVSTSRVTELGGDEARAQIAAARAALIRCRRVSAALADVASVVLAAAGLVTGYDRAGAASGCGTQPRRLEVRA